MEKLLDNYQKQGFLDIKNTDGKDFLILTTPCRFKIDERVVENLKNSYKSQEEIGGILWVKPTIINGETVHLIDKVSYIRNAIEDNPRGDGRNKLNAYSFDKEELNEILNELFSEGYLPIKFHTHPTRKEDLLHAIHYSNLQNETSYQDKKESNLPHRIGDKNLLMPRGLIVGSDVNSDIFIGLYNGFVAPVDFESSKKQIQEENIQQIRKTISSRSFTDTDKALIGIGALLLLTVIIKYPKYSIPVLVMLSTTAVMWLNNTTSTEKPKYFNKLSFGDANIYIP
jgi:hypothetical protein